MKYRGLLLPMILAAMCGDDAFMLNTKRGKGMQSTYRREKIVRTEKEFDISRKRIFMLMLVFSFLLKGAPACEGMRSLYLYNI